MNPNHYDAEAIIRRFILDKFPDIEPRQVGRFPGEQMESDLYVAVTANGGDSDRFEISPMVDIDVFSPSMAEAKKLGFDIETLILRYPHVVPMEQGVAVIDDVVTMAMTSPRPWDTSSMRRQGASYVLTLRR